VYSTAHANNGERRAKRPEGALLGAIPGTPAAEALVGRWETIRREHATYASIIAELAIELDIRSDFVAEVVAIRAERDRLRLQLEDLTGVSAAAEGRQQ
jgi:hypothetical protein